MEKDCVFCRIASGESDGTRVVYRTKKAIAFLPLQPATTGHTLVVPIEHVSSFLMLPGKLTTSLSRAVLRVARAVDSALSPEGMNLITSAGEVASQSVFHLHVHVVPRWTGDRVGAIWPPKKSAKQEDQEDVAEKIRAAAVRVRRLGD